MLKPVAQRDLYPDERLLFFRRSGKSRFILLKGMKPNFSRVKPKAAPYAIKSRRGSSRRLGRGSLNGDAETLSLEGIWTTSDQADQIMKRNLFINIRLTNCA